ncbi:hypothetical protein BDQ17DRAFT_1418889 [Cyathus striatus]|nr:hypothetical protein BDQ17DRAFT_1418889 [Cyathus striatus]
MPIGRSWEWLELANADLFNKCKAPPLHGFRPGDIGHARGSIWITFFEYLEHLGYPLRDEERETIQRRSFVDRYCVVLGHLYQDVYEVCFLTTFGSQSFDALDPVARNFALPIGTSKESSNLKPIQSVPRWFSSSDSYIFAIPARRRVGPALKSNFHARVYLEEVERIKQFIDKSTALLHKNHLNMRDYISARRKFSVDTDTKEQTVTDKPSDSVSNIQEQEQEQEQENESESLSQLYTKPVSPICLNRSLLDVSPETHDISWLLQRSPDDIVNRSAYLNRFTVESSRLAPLNVIPKPYYAPSLRASLATVARLIHR